MVSIVVFLLNILVTVYYAKKRWHVASILFALSACVLFGLSIFMERIPVVSDGLVGLVGVDAYLAMHDILLVYSPYVISPYLAILALAVIAAVVVAVDTTIRFVKGSRRTKPQRVADETRGAWRIRIFFYFKKRKTYLSFCTMLC